MLIPCDHYIAQLLMHNVVHVGPEHVVSNVKQKLHSTECPLRAQRLANEVINKCVKCRKQCKQRINRAVSRTDRKTHWTYGRTICLCRCGLLCQPLIHNSPDTIDYSLFTPITFRLRAARSGSEQLVSLETGTGHPRP